MNVSSLSLFPFVFLIYLILILFLRPHKLLSIFIVIMPVYIPFLSLVYKYTGDFELANNLKILKDILPLILVLIALYIYRIQLLRTSWNRLDLLIFSFALINIIYLIYPNNLSLLQRLYGMRINLLWVLFYSLGRIIYLPEKSTNRIIKVLVLVGVLSGLISIGEYYNIFNIPEFTGLMDYTEKAYGQSRSGEYGLTWTFQTAYGVRRYSSFFANPLAFASSTLITGSAVMYLFYHPGKFKQNKVLIGLFFIIICIGLLLSLSRASMVSFGLNTIILSIWLKKYKNIPIILLAFIISNIYLMKDSTLMYYISDTVSFINPSSIGHANEWNEGLESLISSPFGQGLGMSGPTGAKYGIQVGGENQFIIYGVQLGVIGLMLYLGTIYTGIRYALNTYSKSSGSSKGLIFIAGASRIGLVIPGFTSSIDSYLFVTFISWWLMGYVSQQRELQNENSSYNEI
jgi:hypothetical protein